MGSGRLLPGSARGYARHRDRHGGGCRRSTWRKTATAFPGGRADVKPAPFSYSRAETLDAAFRIFAAADGEAKYLAGGQTLGPMLNLRLTQPVALIDIARVTEVPRDEERPSRIHVGPAVRAAGLADGRVPAAATR